MAQRGAAGKPRRVISRGEHDRLLAAAAPRRRAGTLCGGGTASEPPLLLQHLSQHELDLPVQAPQLVVRPRLQRFEDGGIDAKEERLALSHEPPPVAHGCRATVSCPLPTARTPSCLSDGACPR